MDSLPNFLTHGAPLRARELRYYFPENYQPAKYISTHLKLVYGINVLGTALKKKLLLKLLKPLTIYPLHTSELISISKYQLLTVHC